MLQPRLVRGRACALRAPHADGAADACQTLTPALTLTLTLSLTLTLKVLPTPDALLLAAEAASAGDTLVVAAGLHELSSEIAIDKPLRLLAGPGGSAVLASS